MGKYDAVNAKLQKIPRGILDDDPKYQQRVDLKKHEIIGELVAGTEATAPSSSQLVEAWLKARADKDDAEEVVKRHNLKIAALTQMIEDAFDAEATYSLKLSGGRGGARIQDEPYPIFKDKQAWNKWCRDNGHEAEMTLPWQTAHGIIKEMVLNDQDVPEFVQIYKKPKIVKM